MKTDGKMQKNRNFHEKIGNALKLTKKCRNFQNFEKCTKPDEEMHKNY